MKQPLPAPRAPRRTSLHAVADAAADDAVLTRSQRNSLALALMMVATPGPLLAQAHAPASAAPGTGQAYTTVNNDTVWRLAGLASSKGGGNRAAVMVAILRRNPAAFVQGNVHRLKRGVSITLPSAEDIAAEDPLLASILVESHLRVLDQIGAGAPGLPPLRQQTVDNRSAAPAPTPAAAPVPAAAPPVAKATPAPAPAPAPATASASAPAAAAVPASATTPAAPASAPVLVATPAPIQASTPAEARPPAGSSSSSSSADVQPPASTAVKAPAPMPTPATAPQASANGAELRPLRMLPYAMLVVLLALPVGWAGYRRFSRKNRNGHNRLVAASSDFRDSKNGRGLKPKRVEISTAAVEVARAVETLKPVATLVRRSDDAAQPAPAGMLGAAELREQIALKLEIARASIEVGRVLMARALLAVVQQEGDEAERSAATDLMLKLA